LVARIDRTTPSGPISASAVPAEALTGQQPAAVGAERRGEDVLPPRQSLRQGQVGSLIPGVGEDQVEHHRPGAGGEDALHHLGEPRPGPRQAAEVVEALVVDHHRRHRCLVRGARPRQAEQQVAQRQVEGPHGAGEPQQGQGAGGESGEGELMVGPEHGEHLRRRSRPAAGVSGVSRRPIPVSPGDPKRFRFPLSGRSEPWHGPCPTFLVEVMTRPTTSQPNKENTP
jgi:hypothetical protein